MKKLYFLLFAVSLFTTVKAQIVNIPDTNLKAWLVGSSVSNMRARDLSDNYFRIDTNRDYVIQASEAQNVSWLDLSDFGFSSLEGIANFTNLTYLNCNGNQLTSIDVTGLVNLKVLFCNGNQITSLNVKSLVNLNDLNCYDNQLTSLDLKGLVNLEYLSCDKNQLTSLDVTGLVNLNYLVCFNNQLTSLDLKGLMNLTTLACFNNQLTTLDLTDQIKLTDLSCFSNNLFSLFIKNINAIEDISFQNNPNLGYICVNESQLNYIKYSLQKYGITNCEVNSYCSFTPGGTFYTLEGNSKLDVDSDGCDSNDTNYSQLKFRTTIGNYLVNTTYTASGKYSIPVREGTYTLTPILEYPEYYNVTPSSMTVTFPIETSAFKQDFCIVPKSIHKDLEVTILPMEVARPGFDATYKIIYKNKGEQLQSGSVVLTFNDAVLDFLFAVPTSNNQVMDKLTWDFTNLKPQESREITITFNVNSPMETPAVNNGDRLSFNALINPVAGDAKPVDNSFALRQIVVGSYDPNDKTCLEGDVITPDLIGEYVHYLIRFENTGTYPAENVVVKDLIDLSKFDISTLTPTKASHDYVTKISDGNKVEFIFEKIQLPFDDANNDGYIAFKIKTLPTLVINDTFTNEANIYFDYNFPILTNKAISTFKTLGTQDFQFADYFSLYPNPVNDIINIETKSAIEVKSMAVYDILGQIIIAVPDAKTVSNIDVSKLATGNYFLKMNTDKGTSNVKFIKK